MLGKKRQVVIAKIKQLRDDLKDMAFERNSLMEELKVVRKESLIEKFVAGLSIDILQFHTVAPLGDPLLAWSAWPPLSHTSSLPFVYLFIYLLIFYFFIFYF